MSGGFFRGTSADQDTRFSNKETKLLKSKKFAPQLEHKVDITKVKLDVIRPWIVNRVTELLGFEDEVLINFIFGLLDGKDVDGKQIQIQLTGFMEKNTGKFMKELWSLLLSAQKNISGVPQQFLDAKEEEAKKKKAEADRISREIQQKREKENRECEREIKKRLDDENDDSRVIHHASVAGSKHLLPNVSNTHLKDNEVGRFTKSPVEDRSPSLHRNSSPSPRPRRKSFSNTIARSSSRSHSNERSKSRSISNSPRRRSPSVAKRSYSPVKSSCYIHSPKYARSPSRHRSPYSRRSPSPARRRSPSPIRRRSPTSVRHRSLSPRYHRSPPFVRRRSPSSRRKSPSYVQGRSSRLRQRSPSAFHRRSPSPPRRSPRYRRRSPAPSYRSHDAKVSSYKRGHSQSPYPSPSPSPRYRGHTRTSLSKEAEKCDRASDRPRGRRSSDLHSLEGEDAHSGGGRKAESSARPLSTSLRSPQRDVSQPEEPHHSRYRSSVYGRKTDVDEDEREQDQHGTNRSHMERQERGDASKRANQHSYVVHDGSKPLRRNEFREHSPVAFAAISSPGSEDHLELSESMKRSHSPRRDYGFSQDYDSNKLGALSSHISDGIEYEPGRPEGDASQDHALARQSSSRLHTRDDLSPEKALNGANMTSKRGYKTEEIDDDYSLDYNRTVVKKSIKNVGHSRQMDIYESDDEENESSRHYSSNSKKHKREGIERKYKSHDGSDALSQYDERKEVERRRKEEKKMRKEDKRQRRHQRRKEQHAIKTRGRSNDAESHEKSHKDGDEGHEISQQSDAEDMELSQRKLEVELRKKALESLRAKKAISH